MSADSPEIQVRLFGQLVVTVAGQPVEISGGRARTLLAVLAVSTGEYVLADTLADRLWGEDLPRHVRRSMHTLVSRLRQVLGPTAIRTKAGGYALTLPPHQVDVLHFENLLRTAFAQPDHATELAGIKTALKLWTGDPFDSVHSDWLSTVVTPRLVELYLSGVERRVDLDEAGVHAGELLAGLRELAAAHPLRESLWARLLHVLSDCGRPAEALGLYDVIRSRLAKELGVGPGAQLQEVHQRLLSDDAARHVAVSSEPGAGPPPTDSRPTVHAEQLRGEPRSLPPDVPGFVGRTEQVEQLAQSAGDRVMALAAIDGMAGSGKTALAVHVAHQLAPRFPDGQLFIDLHGHTDGVEPVRPAEALGRLLQALGVPADQLPRHQEDRAGLFRGLLAGRAVLLLLDNAADEAQLKPLLPGSRTCGVLVTSRQRLAGLDTTATVSLDGLSPDEAVTLFCHVAGRHRLTDTSRQVLIQIAEQCGLLPLAIRIAAARFRAHPSWEPQQLLDLLRRHRDRLAELEAGPRSVAAAIDLSYRQLRPELRRAYRLLGLHPGSDFTAESATALLGSPATDDMRELERLLDAHLLQERSFGRYSFHDLVKEHAGRTVAVHESLQGRREALGRLVDHYCRSTTAAVRLLYPDRAENLPIHQPVQVPPATAEQASTWLKAELSTVLAVAEHTVTADRPACARHLADTLYVYFRTVGRSAELQSLHRQAREVARAVGDTAGEAESSIRLGECLRLRGAHASAFVEYAEALQLADAAGHRHGKMAALHGRGLVHGILDRNDEGLRDLMKALDLADELGNPAGMLDALNGLSWIHGKRGEVAQAMVYNERALEIARSVRHRSLGKLLSAAGHHHLRQGDPARAMGMFEQALQEARTNGNRHNELRCLDGLAESHRLLGDLSAAADCYHNALQLARELGSPNWELEAHQGIGRLELALGHAEEALVRHQQALDVASALCQPVDQARAHDGLAHALEKLGDVEGAAHHWVHALTILAAIGVTHTDEWQVRIATLQDHVDRISPLMELPGRRRSR
ncbi:AfsR/SARP family transcriptional regulator [Kribbella flavida]|uniref:AfsR/SARP family transcriptional regulator n=1 Tax=Kribbella flavida TaxID=182640 RepID=UPI000314BC2E|nr:BTAD domain-containing putative transcriptional regulator [Kribbella flavida]